MSTFTPETPSGTTPTVSPNALADAAERRARQSASQPTTAQIASEYEKRQKFRRMIDPGIMRPNAEDQALRSLKTLLTISENLMREPDNEKYHSFKPTNTIIKRDLMDPKGTLEYAREIGFHPKVVDFQPHYTFNPRFMEDLKLGAAILKDYLELVSQKRTRAEMTAKNEKAAKEAAAMKVKLAFMDDRKRKLLRDELEKERRAAHTSEIGREGEGSVTLPLPENVE